MKEEEEEEEKKKMTISVLVGVKAKRHNAVMPAASS